MARLTAVLALFLASLNLTSAAHITLTLPPTTLLPNPSVLTSSTHATLHANGEPLTAPITSANTFIFTHVRPGSYMLIVHSHDFLFEPLRVDVGHDENGIEWVKSWQTFYGNEWDNKGEKRGEGVAAAGGEGEAKQADAVIESRCTEAKNFYQDREGFQVMSLFKNPMILMALFSLVMIVGMPYLMDNLDPEAKAEFEAMQKNNPTLANPATAIQNFDLAGWMAGSTPPPVQQPKTVQSSEKKRR